MAVSGSKNNSQQFAQAVASGASVTRAALKAGVSKRTGYRLAKDADVQRQIQEIRSQILEQVTSRITRLSLRATKTLDGLLSAESESVRLGAARTVLESVIKLKSIMEFETRLQKLEAQKLEG